VITQLLPVMDYWIGARRPALAVEFLWLEGVPIYFPVWGAGEPNGEVESPACVFRTGSEGSWSDDACSSMRAYVCEKEPPLLDPATNHAYWVGWEEQGWLMVTGDCGGTHLATLTSEAEDDVIDPLIGQATRWIGFHDRDLEGDYKWVTTEPFAFTDWGTGEPTASVAESCGGRCGATWCDLGCGIPRTFVCEAD
jgi:hypothetical protein